RSTETAIHRDFGRKGGEFTAFMLPAPSLAQAGRGTSALSISWRGLINKIRTGQAFSFPARLRECLPLTPGGENQTTRGLFIKNGRKAKMRSDFNRREALGTAAIWLGNGLLGQARAAEDATHQLATFAAEVTPPLGHPLMGGGILPAKEIVDPLYAIGFVLLGPGKPIVLVSVDWCEIRNDAFERWRSVLAEAAGTDSQRVLVNCIHQHDAPIVDLDAERILKKHHAAGSICDLDFHERAVQAVARS